MMKYAVALVAIANGKSQADPSEMAIPADMMPGAGGGPGSDYYPGGYNADGTPNFDNNPPPPHMTMPGAGGSPGSDDYPSVSYVNPDGSPNFDNPPPNPPSHASVPKPSPTVFQHAGEMDVDAIEQQGRDAVHGLHEEALNQRSKQQELNSELESKELSAADLEAQLKGTRGENDVTREEIEELRRVIEAQQQANAAITSDIEDLRTATTKSVADKKDEVAELKEIIAEMETTHQAKMNKHHKNHSDITVELANRHAESDELDVKISSLESELTSDTDQAANSVEECAQAQEHGDELEAENLGIEEENSDALSTLEAEIADTQSDFDDKSGLSSKLESAVGNFQDYMKELTNWSERKDVLKAERDHWESTHNENTVALETEVTDLKEKVKDVTRTYQLKIAQIEEDQAATVAENTQLKEEVEKIQAEKETLEAKVIKLEHALAQFSGHQLP